MRLTIRFLGLDLLDLSIETAAAECGCDEAADERGSCTTYPVGFSPPEPFDEFDLPDRDYGE